MNLRLYMVTGFFEMVGQSKLNLLDVYLALASTSVHFIVSPIRV